MQIDYKFINLYIIFDIKYLKISLSNVPPSLKLFYQYSSGIKKSRRNSRSNALKRFHSAFHTFIITHRHEHSPHLIHLRSKEATPTNIFRQRSSRVWTASIPQRLVRAKAAEAALISRRLCPELFHPRHEIYNAVRRAFACKAGRRGRAHRGAQASPLK